MKKIAISLAGIGILFLVWGGGVSAGPVLDRIIAKGELVVGTSGAQPPMTVVSKQGTLMGLDIDLAKAMAAALGVKVTFKTLSFAELLPALKKGGVDVVISSMGITPARNREFAFIGPYFISGKGILTLSDRYAALQEAQGLNSPDVSIAALKASTSYTYAQALMPKATLIAIDAYAQGIEMLLTKKIDVIVADYAFCSLTAYRYMDKGLLAGEAPLSFEPLGVAVPEDTLLINWIHNFISNLKGSGQLKEMQEKWLTGGKWVDELP